MCWNLLFEIDNQKTDHEENVAQEYVQYSWLKYNRSRNTNKYYRISADDFLSNWINKWEINKKVLSVNCYLRSFFSTSSEWIAAIRRLAKDLISTKSVCIVIWGFSCGVEFVGLLAHIIQTFNDIVVWFVGISTGVGTVWSCWTMAGDDGVNSV